MQAQTNPSPILPLKDPGSVMFGKDVVINNAPEQNQRSIAVCSAYNGWLYAVYTRPGLIKPYMYYLRSLDNGLSWSILLEGDAAFPNTKITDLEIIANGNSLNDLQVVLGCTYFDTIMNYKGAIVASYDGEFGNGSLLLNSQYYTNDISLGSDYQFHATNSNPFSIAVLYSIHTYVGDSLIVRTSSNGGHSLDNRQVLRTTNSSIGKVSLDYGYSPSYNSGRYFAVWEEKNDNLSPYGHLFTSHSEPFFNSPFTSPVCIDSQDTSIANKCRNPVISCQFDDSDNDSSSLTEVILFQKFSTPNNQYYVKGLSNLNSVSSTHFRLMNISSSNHDQLQPAIQYNPFDNSFMATYFDSTDQALPYLSNSVNLTQPDQWILQSAGYNDDSNLAYPRPKIELDFAMLQGFNNWIGRRNNGNSIAYFDAPFSTYTSITRYPNYSVKKLFPNPCANIANLTIELKTSCFVNIAIYDLLGKFVKEVFNGYYSAGLHSVKIDTEDIPSGFYSIIIRNSYGISSCKLIVQK